MPELASVQQSSCAKSIHMSVTVWLCDVTKSQNYAESTDEEFQKQCFLWERGASLTFCNFQVLNTEEHV